MNQKIYELPPDLSDREADWVEQGMHYGYPACCIVAFVDRCRRRSTPAWVLCVDHPWDGTGFVPCADCRPIAAADFSKFVAENIAPMRSHPHPFPHGGGSCS